MIDFHKEFFFQQYDQKNIRRRVYDALNVLMAMNIIYKDKKDINWLGFPTDSAQEIIALQVGSFLSGFNCMQWCFESTIFFRRTALAFNARP